MAAGVGNIAGPGTGKVLLDDIESGSRGLDFLVGEEGLVPTLSDLDLFLVSRVSLGRGIGTAPFLT